MSEPKLILCKASAGSGKTFLLTKTYLQIVLNFEHEQHCSYDRILAVTFTNKATEEMKTRILTALTEISKIEKEEDVGLSEFAPILLEENPAWDYKTISYQAKVALSKILHDYGQFAVMTIDKFFNRIVKSFLFELKLHNMSKVSMDTQVALDEAVSDLLNDYGQEESDVLNQWLKDIAFQNVEEGKRWQPEDIIRKISSELLKEQSALMDLNYPVEKTDRLHKHLRSYEEKFRSEVKKLSAPILEILESEGMMEGLFSRNSFPNQTKKTALISDDVYYTDSTIKLIYGEEYPFKKDVLKHPKADIFLQLWENKIQPLARSLMDFYTEKAEERNTYLGFARYLKSLALLTFVSDKMKEYREKNGVMLISDNNSLINKVVQHADAPFLYERIGNKYRYILLDEFQDTSALQWDNLLPLIIEVLSHREACKVLVVGDAKQSIYRWRGGDSRLIQSGVRRDLSFFWDEMGREDVLRNNYRSLPEVVNFNNRFFQLLAAQADDYIADQYLISENITSYYDSVLNLYNEKEVNQIPKKKTGGYVEFKITDTNESAQEEDGEEVGNSGQTLSYVKEVIERLTDEQGHHYRDIAILVRKNKEAVQIADFLKTEGYPVLTSEALLFNEHPVVKLLINALHLLLNPAEDLLQSAVLYHFVLAKDLHLKYPDILEENQRRKYFEKFLPGLKPDRIHEQLKALSIYEIVMGLIDQMELNSLRDEYTEQFLDAVMEYQAGAYQASVTDFIDWWEKKERSVAVSEEAGAIQIVTIHKSKGLEYKVVLIPFFNWKIIETSGFLQPILWPEIVNPGEMEGFKHLPIDFSKARDSIYKKDYQDEVIQQTMDNLNIAYVAMTRAKEKLYVHCPVKKNKKNEIYKNSVGGLAYSTLEELTNQESIPVYTFGNESSADTIKMTDAELTKMRYFSKEENHAVNKSRLSPLKRRNKEAVIGNLIHDILSEYKPGKSINSLLQKFSYQYFLSEDIHREAFDRVTRFFEHPEIINIYKKGSEVLTEKSMFLDGQVYRFDLLVLDEKKGYLYDYKTGLENSNKKTNTEKLLKYRKALTKIGFEIVETAFIFIDERGVPKIVSVGAE